MNKSILVLWGLALTLYGCSDPAATERELQPAPIDTDLSTVSAPNTTALLEFSETAKAFHLQAQDVSKSMLNHCVAMQSDINDFVANPTSSAQLAAQESFLPCYHSWRSLALFFQQPFDLADQKTFRNLVDLIDTRPYLPGYIDGIPDYPYSGLVHELDLVITADNLRSQHRLMDEESASVGFPVIEFFLWKMPANEHWQPLPGKDNATIVERRKAYLKTASDLLTENLTEVVLRWQTDNRFTALPERAQLSFVLKSLQRLTMVELLAGQFEEAVFTDPLWYHPAPISGNGRSYLTIRLKSIQNLIGEQEPTAFSKWLDKVPDLTLSTEQLRESLQATLTSVTALPVNYPMDSSADDTWQLARQNLAQLTVYFSQLSKHFQVTILTD